MLLRKLLVIMSFGWIVAPCAVGAAEAQKSQAPAHKPDGTHRPADPMGNLKPYEERRYRIDMLDCEKQKGGDRKVCERAVRNKAAAKSRRRAMSGH